MSLTCMVCDVDIDVEEDELDEGDIVTCDECGADFRVVSVDPDLELELLEDEDDEDEDEDLEFEEEDEEDETWT